MPGNTPSDESTKLLSIGSEVDVFINRIESLFKSLPLLIAVMHITERDARKQMRNYLENNAQPSLEKEDIFNIPSDQYRSFKSLDKRLNTARLARTIVPHSFLISLVSQFDAYLGRLIRILFYIKPEILNASEKNLSFAQLMEFDSMESAREYIIEKEVESVLRDSHTSHFRWLEKKFNLTLTKDLEVWPYFIELTERRNLFVHTGGVVSSQFLNVCKEHKVRFDQYPFASEPRIGDELEVTLKYFNSAYESIFEIGVKLAHVLWRKLQPDDLEKADDKLLYICYELIADEQYHLARKLLDFATCTLKRYSTDDYRRRFIINRAQVYKWLGNSKKTKEIIENEDWSASSDTFQLAVDVLQDNFQKAGQVMKRIGINNQITKADYHDWPLFKEFRDTQEFSQTYKKIFNEEFTPKLNGDNNLLNILSDTSEL